MNTQDITANNHGDNPESVAANASIQESKSETRAKVLSFIRSTGVLGTTADAVAEAFNATHNHVAPRISELKEANLVIATDTRRKTHSGRTARVLIAST